MPNVCRFRKIGSIKALLKMNGQRVDENLLLAAAETPLSVGVIECELLQYCGTWCIQIDSRAGRA